MKNSLKKKIETKLEKLHQLLEQISEAQIIQPTEPETWDSDLLANLTANLKAALQLLENKTSPQEKDPWGEPLILEEGLGSLMNAYQEEEDYE